MKMYFMHVDAVLVAVECIVFAVTTVRPTHAHAQQQHSFTCTHNGNVYAAPIRIHTQATRILRGTRDVCPPATATKSELLPLQTA